MFASLPKALELHVNEFYLRILPHQYDQKTHVLYLFISINFFCSVAEQPFCDINALQAIWNKLERNLDPNSSVSPQKVCVLVNQLVKINPVL